MSNTQSRAIFHRDGTLTFWSVRDQRWRYRVAASEIDAGHLNTFKSDVRDRILERAKKDATSGPTGQWPRSFRALLRELNRASG